MSTRYTRRRIPSADIREGVCTEMLDALRGLLEVHDAMGAGQSYAAAKARAAIAKATAA